MLSIIFPLMIISQILPLALNSVLPELLGDRCVDQNKLNGTCKFIYNCPHIGYLKESGVPYHRCGFQDGKEVVCCAQRNIDIKPLESKVPNTKFAEECEKYKSKMFDLELTFTSLTAGASPIKKTQSKCTQYSFPLVVNGENAKPKEFPHMALLGCKNENGNHTWLCGGSLISMNHVLTAAHCFNPQNKCNEINIVRLGELDLESVTDDAEHRDFNIANVITHPRYNSSAEYNDIALIKLDTDIKMTEYIRPACLPYEDYDKKSQLIITGWGATEYAQLGATYLQKATVDYFEQSKCNYYFVEEDNMEIKERTQICAGSENDRKDTCQGDSGGPLQIIHPNYPCMYSVVGITSHGQSCDGLGVYTRVYYYNDWIEKVVWGK